MQSSKTQSKSLENKLAFPPTNLHHGLLNKIGENNCFLNVTIQALWHLGPFRTELKKFINTFSAKPDQIESGGLMEAVCNMFVQYEFTDQEVLPPTELRESLGNLSGRYELGKIADANEAFDSILHKIHAEQSATCPHKKKCLSHRVFGGLVMEQTVCTKCRATSEPTLRSDFILCFQALELINEARDMITDKDLDAVAPDKKAKPDKHTLRSRFFGGSNHDLAKGEKNETGGETASLFDKNDFGRLLHKCMEVNVRSCPSIDDPHNSAPHCEGKGKVHFYSLEPPLAMALSVGWTQLNEEAQTLKDFYSLISYSIRLSDLFIVEGVSSTPGGPSSSAAAAAGPTGPSYTFRGLVCYYGMHYVSIFQESGILDQERYLLFDDQKIRPIGDWNAVIAECVKSKYQPVLLLYQLDKNSAGYILDEDGDGEQQETRSMYEIHECDSHDSSSHSTSTTGYMSTASSDKLARATKDTYQDVTEARAAVDSQKVMLDRLQQDMSDATVATVVPGSCSSVTVTVSTAKSNVSSQFGDSYSSSRAENAAASDAKHTKHHSHHSHHHDSKGAQHRDSHGEAVMDGEQEHIVGDGGLSLSIPADKVATSSSTGSVSSSDHKSVAAHHKSGEPRPYSDSTSFSKGTGRSYTDNNYSSQKHTVLPANYKAAIFQSNFYVQPSDSCKYTHNSGNNNSSNIQFDGVGPFSTSFRNRNSSEPLKIAKWSYRSLKYNVLLEQEWLDDGKRTLGIRLEHDLMNHIVVTSFYRNPFTGGMLPAERCKKIERNDRIVAVNGVEVTTVTALQKFLYDVPSDRVIMELESATKLNLWFQCPACSMSNLVDEGTETGLKEHNNGRMEAHRRVKSWGKFMIKCIACKTQSVADDSIV